MKKQKTEKKIEFPNEFIVMGADLSLNRPGYCAIRYFNGSVKPYHWMSIDNKTSKKPRGAKLLENIYALNTFTDFIIEKNESIPIFFVREASINNASFGKRSGTAARTGISEMVGVTDAWLWKKKKIEWEEIYPISVKKYITGNAKASKEEVAKSLRLYMPLMLTDFKNDDESDAAAVAVAWLIKNKVIETKENVSPEDKK